MKAIIEGFARGGGRQYPSKVIVRVIGYEGKVDSLLGKTIIYRDGKGKVYRGRLVRRHGKRNPLLIAVFKPNLPGQAIGSIAEISG